MTALLIILAVTGWGATFVMWRVRRADRERLARTTERAPSTRPDFSVFAAAAERSGLPASAAMYRTMDDAWPKPDSPQAIRTDPGRNHLPTPRIDREDVELLHGVHVYRDLNRPADAPKYGRNYDDIEARIRNEHPLCGCCICHHAIWHSCPDPKLGERIFNALPSRGVKAVVEAEHSPTSF